MKKNRTKSKGETNPKQHAVQINGTGLDLLSSSDPDYSHHISQPVADGPDSRTARISSDPQASASSQYMSPEVFSNDPIPSLNPLSPRQVTFENHDTEHDLSTHMEMESMATLTETAGGECTPEQVSQFLRSNPSYLTKHVISEVNLDVVQSWLMQLCASGRRRSETEAIPANSTVNHATKRKHSKPVSVY